MKERWKPVPIAGFEDLYEVSTLGKVRSRDRIMRNGSGEYLKKGIILHPVDNGSGYLKVELKDGIHKKRVYVHRLVAYAFLENKANKPFINHIDNNPYNSSVENLEWCTPQENSDWMVKQARNKRTNKWIENLHKSQSKFYKAVIGENIETGEIVRFEKLNDVVEAGFEPSCVCCCCKGKRKTHKGFVWEYEKIV